MHTLLTTIQGIDESVLATVNGWVGHSAVFDLVLTVCAKWLVYAIPLVLVVAWFWVKFGPGARKAVEQRVDLVMLTIAGLASWQGLDRIIKLFYFRPRPWVTGQHVKELFFHRPDQSFPSDHAAFLFGLATFSYLLGWRKTGTVALTVAVLVSAARVITGTHWLSDIIGGLVVGAIGAWIIWLFRVPLERYIVRPLVKFATNLGL